MAKLTTKFVTKVQSDNIKVFWDDQLKGFGLCVRPSGKKTFLLKYRIGRGRRAVTKKHSLGSVPVVSVEAARLKAKNFLFVASQGIDPIKKDQESLTIKELCEQYIDRHAVLHKKKSSLVRDENLIKGVIIPVFGKIRVADLNRSHLIKYHHSKKDTSIMANRFLALISTMMNLAEKWEYRPQNTNPCKYVDRYKEKKRQVYLSMDQLERVGQAMRQLKNTESFYALSALKMLLVTGCRTSEILNLKREYVDIANNCIHLPDSKTGARTIHLPPVAFDILNALPSEEGFVFRNPRENKRLTTLRCLWKKICRITDLKDYRLHDLRHTYASFAVSGGFSLPIIAKMLGHADIKTTERYAHLHQDPVNKAIDDVSLKIKKVMEI
ncbi:MAG: Tyrosine recombinase XerD [Alphaproteobacteria bacterium MarineAlpha5_Bin2]|nr:MAG: Tyrosine recombinase XerD [Alphaproteobacteria bacterium MarineAlpha5_Bin2]